MFYYLGRKKRIAHLYPNPTEDIIIEPFAGSAAYSLHENRWQKSVILNDLNPITVNVWRYLLSATEKDILNLPSPEVGSKLSHIEWLTEDERWLIAFHINPGANQRSDVVTKFNRWPAGKKYIVNNLYKIKHWKILQEDYKNLSNQRATWFVDPPYHKSGQYYMTNDIDYTQLSSWCMDREGQVIVCEQSGASWLEFKPLVEFAICGKSTTKEMIWTNTHNL